MKDELYEQIYLTMNGDLYPEDRVPGVEDAFAEGEKCALLYERMYHAERRLEDRLGLTGHNDDDVEEIIRCMQSILEELCYRMYCYGAEFGRKE